MGLSVFAAAAEAPDRPAIVTDRETFTYDDLARRVRNVVRALRDRELTGGAPVALVAEPDLPTLVVVHSLIALGTPALLLHPRHTAPERDALVEAANARGPVVPAELAGPANGVGSDLEGAAAPGSAAPAHEVALASDAGDDPAPPPSDERPLAIIPTSGTSGRPKGVVLSRRAFAASAAASAANLGWQDDDRWLLPLPLAHVGGLSIVTRCLLARRTVVLAPDAEPAALLEAVRRHRATLVSLVPTLLARIIDARAPDDTGDHTRSGAMARSAAAPPDTLRAVLLGGAAASPALLARAADAAWPVLTTYGLTEACSQVTTQPYGTLNRGELGSGPPLPGLELRIGPDDAVQVRGPTLFSGYLPADPGGPFTPDGWFPTGDHGRLDGAGNLHILGRRADRIVTGGENVDPLEVERALERLPGVAEACVFGVPDAEWGEVVCTAVVSSVRTEALAEGVRSLRGELAAFKLPRRVAVVDALPRNATGKVDRRETARRAMPRLRPL